MYHAVHTVVFIVVFILACVLCTGNGTHSQASGKRFLRQRFGDRHFEGLGEAHADSNSQSFVGLVRPRQWTSGKRIPQLKESFLGILLAFSPQFGWQHVHASQGQHCHRHRHRVGVPLLSAAVRTPQVIRLRDAATNQEISIVGTAHGNPASKKLAAEELRSALGRHKQLGAVVVELCQFRWSRYLELAASEGTPFPDIGETALAGLIAIQNDVPVLLGDIDDEVFLNGVQQRTKQYCLDMFDPLGGGWQSIFNDFARVLPPAFQTSDIAESELLLEGEAPLGAADFLQPEWLLGLRKSISRTLSLIPPVAWVPFICAFAVLLFIPESSSDAEFRQTAKIIAEIANLLICVPLLRLICVPFLEERDAELARSIRHAARQHNAPVVAILGAAHVNGVARLLISDQLSNIDEREVAGVWVEDKPPPQVMDTLSKLWSRLVGRSTDQFFKSFPA